MEENLTNGETDVDEDFLLLQPLDIITKNVEELRQIIKEKKKNLQKEKEREKDKEKVKDDKETAQVKDRENSREKEREREKEKEKESKLEQEHKAERSQLREKARQEREKEIDKSRERKEKDKDRSKQLEDHRKEMSTEQEAKVSSQPERNCTSGLVPMDISSVSISEPLEFSSSDVTILEGHANEVCTCAWSPAGSVLASGSGDSTARIWTVADGPSRPGSQNGPLNVAVLEHVQLRTHEGNKDVTTLDWNGDGTLLATGAYDGHARIWKTNGELKSTFGRHKGPIFTLKWNKKGDYLLTGSCDRTAIVWDVQTEEIKQQFDLHTGVILDVDWRNNASFATCSDKMIYVCKIGESRPVKSFSGHKAEVNCVKWDPTGSILASCSDDITAKIWSMKQEARQVYS